MIADVPEPDYDDPKELWAFFGLAFYAAQVLEQGIVNLAVAARAAGNQEITPELIRDFYKHADQCTFGQILRIIRKTVSLQTEIDADLRVALETRNCLAHRFFLAHDRDLLSEDGRHNMIDELREHITFFKRFDSKFDSIWQAAWDDLGVTNEMIQSELESIGVKSPADYGSA